MIFEWTPPSTQLDRINVKRAIDMYRNGLIDFNTLDKKWIEPTAQGRKGKDWADVYLPAGKIPHTMNICSKSRWKALQALEEFRRSNSFSWNIV